jgi:hypothetical protein
MGDMYFNINLPSNAAIFKATSLFLFYLPTFVLPLPFSQPQESSAKVSAVGDLVVIVAGFGSCSTCPPVCQEYLRTILKDEYYCIQSLAPVSLTIYCGSRILSLDTIYPLFMHLSSTKNICMAHIQ